MVWGKFADPEGHFFSEFSNPTTFPIIFADVVRGTSQISGRQYRVIIIPAMFEAASLNISSSLSVPITFEAEWAARLDIT